MKIKSVAVLGAGAVGSYVIWGLSQKPEVRLGVIAEGERADRLRKNGCAINGRIYHPEVWSPEEAHNVDLLVVALKYGSLEGTLKSIQKTTGGHTVVMSLMNGVDSEEIIGRTVGTEHVLPALIKALEEKNDGKFNYTGNQKPIIEITVNENAVIHFELWPEIAPIACGSVMQLAEKKIFDGRAIERLEPGFVLQPLFFDGVDPQIDIMVEPEFKTNPENAKIVFERGIVAMAGDPENSSGSQYYITLAASERLNGNFTVIGKVIDGWDEIERLEHVEVEEAIEPQSGFVYHRPVKTEMITKVRRIK